MMMCPFKLLGGILVAGFFVCSCGKKGSSSGGGDDGNDDSAGGVVEQDIRQVTGKFFLGTKAKPAASYAVWLVDQTNGAYFSRLLGEEGAFTFELDDFTEGHIYSLHLVDPDFREVGALDLSSLNAGTQAAFTYGGGYGFDLGEMVVDLTARGDINFTAPGLKGAIGGGFSLRTSSVVGLMTTPLPKSVTSFTISDQLVVFDPAAVLYSFYNRTSYPSLYAKDLATYSRIGSVVTQSAIGSVSRVFIENLTDAGSWLAGSRLAANPYLGPQSSSFWGKSDFSWTAEGNAFSAYVYSGRFLPKDTIVVATVRPSEGAQERVVRKISVGISMIPKVTALDVVGGGLVNIDYSAATGSNGLTRPFCLSATDPRFGIMRPLDQDGAELGIDSLSAIEFAFDYFSTQDGTDTLLNAVAADFPATFQAVVQDTLATGAIRSWDPATLTAVIAPPSSPAPGASYDVSLQNQLFLTSIGGKSVAKIRLRVTFGSPDSALRAGTVIWLKIGC